MIATVRHAFRSLRKSPAFTLTVIATLGIGIGLNAAIFAVVDCVLLRPLGYHDADRIVALRTHFVSESRSFDGLGGDDYVDISKQVHGLESTAFYQSWADGLALNGKSVYLQMAVVSPRFAEVMGVQPVAGRLFNPEEKDGRDILVSENFAQEYFGSSQAALGKTASYGTQLYTIVGVLPNGFSFPDKTRVWIEQKQVPENLNRTAYNQEGIGKRRADVSQEQLAAEFAAFSAHLQKAYVEDAHKALESVPLQQDLVGGMQSRLSLMMGSVAVILLIICANITHLQLVRATRELRAVTIRTRAWGFAFDAGRTCLAGGDDPVAGGIAGCCSCSYPGTEASGKSRPAVDAAVGRDPFECGCFRIFLPDIACGDVDYGVASGVAVVARRSFDGDAGRRCARD